jgi:hypothetical protein
MFTFKFRNRIKNSSAMICFASLLGTSFTSFADFSIEGQFQGKSIYVQNPIDEDGFGYCINRITLNGEVIPVDVHASAFQINLGEYNIKIGDEVVLLFEHELGCRAKILNPEALRPKSTFVIQELACTESGVLTWSTTEESGKLNFLVEQYKWNKWVVIGEVTGVGTPALNKYTFTIAPHSGQNTIRVSQIDNTSKKRTTQSITFQSKLIGTAKLSVSKENKTISFLLNDAPIKTKYEIFDTYGNIVKKGYNSSVNYSNLKPGIYHVNFDNKNDKIIIK